MLSIQNVSKSFGGVKANKNISFSVQPDTIVGLIGPNGAGKSTLFNLITAIHPPTEGKIMFEDHRIDRLPTFKIAPVGIARTFQNLQVFKHMSVIENVMVGYHTKAKTGIFKAALRFPSSIKEESKIYEKCLEYIHFVGLEDDISTQAGSLSLGKLRLLELARALATDPKLVLLDEIAAGLNHKETQEMSKLIQEIRNRGIAVLVVEHDMDLVMNICDQVVVLDQGEKIAEGTPEEIQNNENVIQAYLGADMEGDEVEAIQS